MDFSYYIIASLLMLFVLLFLLVYRYGRRGQIVRKLSISTQILVVFFLVIFSYVAMSNYVFVKYGMNGITENLSRTTDKIGKTVTESVNQSVSGVIGASFVDLGTRLAGEVEQLLQMAETDVLRLANTDTGDQRVLAEQLLDFYQSQQSSIWYNLNTDLQPLEVKEIVPLYTEIAFVNASGTEIVKIDQTGASSVLRDVSDPKNTEFQNEDYFQKTIGLNPNEVYVSRLNTWYLSPQEAWQIVPAAEQQAMDWEKLPGRDTMKQGNIKFSAPVYEGERVSGVMVLSLDYRHLQETVKHIDPALKEKIVSATYQGNYILMFDDNGDTLVHPKPSNIRGYTADGAVKKAISVTGGEGIFNLRDYASNEAYPRIYETTIINKEHYITAAVDLSGRRKLTVSVPIFYDRGEYQDSGLFGGLMLSVATDKYYESLVGLDAQIKGLTSLGNAEMNQVVKRVFVTYLALASLTAVLLLIFLMYVLHRTIFYPLRILSKASQDVAAGSLDVDLDVKTTNELSDLAALFRRMISSVKKSQEEDLAHKQELEKNVTAKTEELNRLLKEARSDGENLEKQRAATLNILEDVSESQDELKRANEELALKSRELSALKSLSDEFAGVLDVFEAVMLANKFFTKFFDFTSINYLVVNPVEEGGVIYTTYVQEPVSEGYLKETEKDLLSFIEQKNSRTLNSVLKIVQSIVPKYFGKKVDNNLDFKPTAYAYFTLAIGGKNLGVIQVTTRAKTGISAAEQDFIKAIVLALAFSIDRLESLMLAQHSKTVSLVESLTDGVVMFNSNKDTILMNPAFVRYTGFSREYFNLDDLYKLLPDMGLEELVDRALHLGNTAHLNEISIMKRFYEVFITPVRDNKGKVVGGAIILHDITYLKEMDQMKTEFVSVASHQLRTPLTAIKLFTEMLVRGDVGRLNDEQQEYMENINESTERMVSLVNDLLNVTRIESGRLSVKIQPVDLVRFIKSIIAEAKPLISSRTQQILFNYREGELGEISLDENLTRQVIHNLVVNAIRYSPEQNGVVTVNLRKKDEKDFIISVKDNGIGVPADSQRRIFEKFYRADNAIKSNTEGTGLGLYVSKMIVESSGGKIWFESKAGEGTEFFVQLPLKGMEAKEGQKGLAIS